jgi:hypothetical protein
VWTLTRSIDIPHLCGIGVCLGWMCVDVLEGNPVALCWRCGWHDPFLLHPKYIGDKDCQNSTMSVVRFERIPRVVYTTVPNMEIEETRPFDEPNSSIPCYDRPSVRTTTLTNTAVGIHENSLRIEEELQYLEKQIQLLLEQDLVLTQMEDYIYMLDCRVNDSNHSGLSSSSSNDLESILTNLG